MKLPERLYTEDGQIRKIGLELEFSGISPEKVAVILQNRLGGNLTCKNIFSYQLKNTEYGDFNVEIDAAFLKQKKYKELAETAGIDLDSIDNTDALEDIIKNLASIIVPCEIVMPPVPADKLQVAEEITCLLRKEKAKGTGQSIFYAFGLHINAELASRESVYLLNHMRAFSLLYDWICKDNLVDISRRITPYINPYPESYLDLILSQDYRPEIDELIDDYLEKVSSRNHGLDMLPAFAYISETAVMQKASEPELINPRPAFHYRLSNCRIDEPEWTIEQEWKYWLKIEDIADNENKLHQLINAWTDLNQKKLQSVNSEWPDKVKSVIGNS